MNDASNAHPKDLLPTHVNGTLGPAEGQRVDEHLRACAACRTELASWEALAGATVAASERLPSPPPGVLEGALAKIEAEEEPSEAGPAAARRPAAKLSLAVQLLAGQMPLVRREIWSASAVTMAMGCLVSTLTATGASAAGSAFAVFAPVIAAVGVAFVYGPENDPSLEVALSTPTSPRLVLLARLVLVYGYDLALALAATVALAAANGAFGLWPLISLWIGPMLFLSALALLVSLLFSPTAALFVALALWGTRLAAGTGNVPGQTRPAWAETAQALWHADALLPLAVVLLAVALFVAPRVGPVHRGTTS